MLQKTTTRKQIQQQIGKLGTQKYYQLILAIIMSLCWVLIALLIVTGVFIFMNPVYTCSGNEKSQKQACKILVGCQINNKFTATSYSGIVCDKQILRSFIQSAFYVGNLLALVTFAPLSDSIGRRPTSLVITVMAVISQGLMYIGIRQSIWALIIIAQLINGVFVAGMSINTYVFTAEYCSEVQKDKYIMVYWVTGSFGGVLMFLFYTYMPNWDKYILFGLTIPLVVLLVLEYFLVYQTPHFTLFLQKNLQNFNNTIQNLSKFNNLTPQQQTTIKSLAQKHIQQHTTLNTTTITTTITKQPEQQQKTPSFFKSIQTLSQNRQYLWIALRLSVAKIGVNAFIFSLIYCFDRLGYSFGWSMLIFGVNQMISSFFASFVLEEVSKKPVLLISVLISSILGLSYFLPFITGNQIWQSLIICLATISTMFSFVSIGLMSVQYFPTQISSTSIGIIDCISYTINIFMPFFVNILHDSHLNPVAGIAVLLLFCGIGPIIGLKSVDQKKKEQGQESFGVKD